MIPDSLSYEQLPGTCCWLCMQSVICFGWGYSPVSLAESNWLVVEAAGAAWGASKIYAIWPARTSSEAQKNWEQLLFARGSEVVEAIHRLTGRGGQMFLAVQFQLFRPKHQLFIKLKCMVISIIEHWISISNFAIKSLKVTSSFLKVFGIDGTRLLPCFDKLRLLRKLE